MNWLLGIFFVSGAAGLAYQIVWSRLFSNALGHELPAVLAVVGAFFGGLALGGWLLQEKIHRSSRPGLWYAGLELIIGAWSLVLVLVLPWANDAASRLIGLDASALRQWLVAFLFPFIVLLPATMAMGATWPAMERFAAPLVSGGRVVGALYAANTLGALTGVVGATFLLMAKLGFSTTAVIFAGLNFLCAAAAWNVELKFQKFPPALQSLSKAARKSNSQEPSTSPNTGTLAPLLFFTGFLGIGYEVLGVRILARVLENTIYTFASVLAVFLLGTAVGAAAFHRWLKNRVRADLAKLLLFALSGGCAIGGVALVSAQSIYAAARAAFGDSLAGGVLAEISVALAVFTWPTLAMGALFAHLVQAACLQGFGAGRATALSTFGSALAPLGFGVIAMSALGSKWTLLLVVLGYGALALPVRRAWQWLAFTAPLVVGIVLPTPLQSPAPPSGGQVIEHREGAMDSVAVIRHADGHRSLLVNNRLTMGGTGAAAAERRHAHIPLLLHPAPQRALFLGLGTGITFAAAGAHPGLLADGVELLPEVIAASPHFAPENSLPPDNRLNIHAADARRFVRATDARYDVIVADLFHPARDGAGTLYTHEHFAAIRARLAPGGLFCQWLPLYQLDEPMLRVITRTFLEIFPNGSAWLLRANIDTPVLGLIGSPDPFRFTPGYFDQRARDTSLLSALQAVQLRDRFALFGSFVADAGALRPWAADAPLNTDDHPRVVFGAPRFQYLRRAAPYGRLLSMLEKIPAKPESLLGDSADHSVFARDLANYLAARNVYLRGLVDETEGRPAAALDRFVESARLSEHFTTAYARCLTLATQQIQSDPAAARALLQRLDQARPERPVARQLLDRLDQPSR